jgi:hypothetical protein
MPERLATLGLFWRTAMSKTKQQDDAPKDDAPPVTKDAPKDEDKPVYDLGEGSEPDPNQK